MLAHGMFCAVDGRVLDGSGHLSMTRLGAYMHGKNLLWTSWTWGTSRVGRLSKSKSTYCYGWQDDALIIDATMTTMSAYVAMHGRLNCLLLATRVLSYPVARHYSI